MIKFYFNIVMTRGKINEDANPNGSVMNIAGICNKDRNVFGMMPPKGQQIKSYLMRMANYFSIVFYIITINT